MKKKNNLPSLIEKKTESEYANVKGIIFDIKRYAIHDGPGIRSTVFFKGCPLRCWWCHNPEGLRPEIEKILIEPGDKSGQQYRIIGEEKTVKSVMDEITGEVLFFDESGGGVTFSGGEPLMQPDFLKALLFFCQKSGIHTAVDTSGYAPYDIIESIIDMVDLFLYDLKFLDPELHAKYTGMDNRLIISNLKKLDGRAKKIIIRFPIIPEITGSKKNVEQISQFIASLHHTRDIDLLPYHQFAQKKYQRLNIINRMKAIPEPLPPQLLEEIKHHFESRGFRVNHGESNE
ncbi:MAG: glycyl-radical enzyme activating protein [Candidatus Aminicenantes bacterium]|nr:glycyl-radical enzyme activating protein [Candidatus Aminicenantes bacterium]